MVRREHIAADAHGHGGQQDHQAVAEGQREDGDDLSNEPVQSCGAEDQIAGGGIHARKRGQHQHHHQGGVQDAVPVGVAPDEGLHDLHIGQVCPTDSHGLVCQQPAQKEAQQQTHIEPGILPQAVQVPARADEGGRGLAGEALLSQKCLPRTPTENHSFRHIFAHLVSGKGLGEQS